MEIEDDTIRILDTYDDDKLEELLVEYKQELSQNPKDMLAILKIAQVVAALKDEETAAELFIKSFYLITPPEIHEALKNYKPLMEAGELQNAYELLNNALKVRPHYIELINAIEEVATKMGNEELVKRCETKLKSAILARNVLLVCVANQFIIKERYESAIDVSDILLEICSKSLGALNCKGISLYHLDRYEEAIECFKKAIEIKADDPEYYYNLGNCYNSNLNKELAVQSYQRAVQINPTFRYAPYAYYGLAQNLMELERNTEACDAFEKSIELNPFFEKTYLNYGKLLIKLEDYVKGALMLCEAAKQIPNSWKIYLLLSELYKKYKKYGLEDMSQKFHAKAVEMNPVLALSFLF